MSLNVNPAFVFVKKSGMENRLVYLISFGLILCLSGCKTNNANNIHIEVSKFPKEETLYSESLQVPPVLLHPGGMFISDNYLIVCDLEKDTIFSFFELPSCRFVEGKGLKGRGPNELLNVNPQTISTKDNGLSLYDSGTATIKRISFDNGFKIIESIPLHSSTHSPFGINCFIELGDDIFCFLNDAEKDTEYVLQNNITGSKEEFGLYPNLTNNYADPVERMFTYLKGNAAKPDQSLFVSFYHYFKFFRIFNANGEILKEISVHVEPYNKHYSSNTDENLVFYGQPKVSDNYIYVFCANRKPKEPSKGTTELQVWDWDGNPIAKYELDKTLSHFVVSEEYNKIYAVNVFEEDRIYTYDLPL